MVGQAVRLLCLSIRDTIEFHSLARSKINNSLFSEISGKNIIRATNKPEHVDFDHFISQPKSVLDIVAKENVIAANVLKFPI